MADAARKLGAVNHADPAGLKWLCLACPACQTSPVSLSSTQARCLGCQKSYPVIQGIIDLLPLETGSREANGAHLLLESFPHHDFEQLVRQWYGAESLRKDLFERYVNHELANPSAWGNAALPD